MSDVPTHRDCANRRPLSAAFTAPDHFPDPLTPDTHCCCSMFSDCMAIPIDTPSCRMWRPREPESTHPE